MIQENQQRKSKRNHVMNPIYSEGIDELRKDAEIRYRKKCRNNGQYQSQPKKDQTYGQLQPSELSEERIPKKQNNQEILCILPNDRVIKIQVIISKSPSTPKIQPKKQQKPTRKHSTDLLSIFEQVIKQAGYDCSNDQQQKPKEQQNGESSHNKIHQVQKQKCGMIIEENQQKLINQFQMEQGCGQKIVQNRKQLQQNVNEPMFAIAKSVVSKEQGDKDSPKNTYDFRQEVRALQN